MPNPKMLTSQAGRGMVQKTYKFGGGKNEIRAEDDGGSTFGYIINSGGGDDMIFGSDFSGRGTFDSTADPRTEFGDLLIGGDGSDHIQGGLGDDTIYGGNEDGSDDAKGKDAFVSNSLFGDIQFDSSAVDVTLGSDVLIGGSGDGSIPVFNIMVGDSQSVSGAGTFTGGADRLVSGTNANDTMTGDFGGGAAAKIGGADTFVFGVNNGEDLITDFELDRDKIELVDLGYTDVSELSDLWTTQFGLDGTQLTLDLDGVLDGRGDTIVFSGFVAEDQSMFDANDSIFIFTDTMMG